MYIEKAIELLSEAAFWGSITLDSDFKTALKLGIEAMKKWRLLREGRAGVIDPLLPGETIREGDPQR